MTGPDDEPADADLTVTATAIGRVVDLRTEVLPILPTGELYEVWFVATDDSPATPHRISAGTFTPTRTDAATFGSPPPSTPLLFPIVEITAEPGDGNPLATGPVVLARRDPQ